MFVAFVSLGILGLLLGGLLAFASIKFHVETDPRVEQLEGVLPGSNCGSCGKPGCSGYAAELAANENTPIDLCAPGGHAVAAKIAEILGREYAGQKTKKLAFVFCKGGKAAKDKFIYSGQKTCLAAVMVSGRGAKACQYGCIGYGDCVTVCKFDAIKMTEQNVPFIDTDKCTNCKACIKICPKKIIKEVMHKETSNVICSSLDNPKISKNNCEVACIACNICVRNCPYKAITLVNNLAVIDREICTNCGICVTKCPTKAII